MLRNPKNLLVTKRYVSCFGVNGNNSRLHEPEIKGVIGCHSGGGAACLVESFRLQIIWKDAGLQRSCKPESLSNMPTL